MNIRRPIIISAILIFAMACLSLAAAVQSLSSAGADAACRIGAVGYFRCIGAA